LLNRDQTVANLLNKIKIYGKKTIRKSEYFNVLKPKILFQVILCKDGDGKVGVRVKSINKGIFVCLVAVRKIFVIYIYLSV